MPIEELGPQIWKIVNTISDTKNYNHDKYTILDLDEKFFCNLSLDALLKRDGDKISKLR